MQLKRIIEREILKTIENIILNENIQENDRKLKELYKKIWIHKKE